MVTHMKPTIKDYCRNKGQFKYSKNALTLMNLYAMSPDYCGMSVDEFFEHVYESRANSKCFINFDCADDLRNAMTQYIIKFGVGSCVYGTGPNIRLYINNEGLEAWLTLSSTEIRHYVPQW